MRDTPTSPPHQLQAILGASERLGFDMLGDAQAGCLLETLAASKPGGRLLELGTGTGYCTAWLLAGMDARAQLLSIESDPALHQIAKTQLGDDPRVSFRTEDGGRALESMTDERYDLVFADTWPGKYTHLDLALEHIAPGGLYVVDDMLPQRNWPNGHAEKAAWLVQTLEQRRDFAITKLAWSSGIIIGAKLAIDDSGV
jgi:predicted O-methyltransferase YrrM